MPRTRIKICGVTTEQAALAAADAGADAIGLVFAPGSPRYLEPARAWEIASVLPPFVASVALFVDVDLERFIEIEQTCPATLVQFHGNEPDELVRHCGPNLIKAVRFDPTTIAGELARWNAVEEVDAILIDGSSGGKGTSFDWSSLPAYLAGIDTPIILAGGLTPDNVGDAIRAVRPFAVDVSSGVERDRGVKDVGLIEAFCRAVREADAR